MVWLAKGELLIEKRGNFKIAQFVCRMDGQERE